MNERSVEPCATCHNRGTIPSEPVGREKLCPSCGGASNPALADELRSRERERGERNAQERDRFERQRRRRSVEHKRERQGRRRQQRERRRRGA